MARTDLPKPVIYHPSSSGHTTEEEDACLAPPTSEFAVALGETSSSTHIPAATESSPAKDECFPELAHHTSSSNSPENDETSMCSCEHPATELASTTGELTVIPREGGAFPKAFERDLVTPTAHLVEADNGGGKVEDKVTGIYDSGIDMRDVMAATTASETIAEEDSSVAEPEERNAATAAGGPRKKASSVSFCTELDKEIVPDVTDKPESKKTKVIFVIWMQIFFLQYYHSDMTLQCLVEFQ